MAIDLLGGLTDDDRRMVEAKLSRRDYPRGATLFLQGDVGDGLHLIERGRVAVRTSNIHGDEVTLAVLGAHDFFGEQALVTPEARRTATVVALDRVETRVLHRRDFDELRRTRPTIERFLVEVLASQVRRLSGQILEVLYVPVEARVVNSLVRLAELAPADANGAVDLPVRQEDLASLAGTTRSTANRVLKQLERDGLVQLRRGRTTIPDVAALPTAPSPGGPRPTAR